MIKDFCFKVQLSNVLQLPDSYPIIFRMGDIDVEIEDTYESDLVVKTRSEDGKFESVEEYLVEIGKTVQKFFDTLSAFVESGKNCDIYRNGDFVVSYEIWYELDGKKMSGTSAYLGVVISDDDFMKVIEMFSSDIEVL